MSKQQTVPGRHGALALRVLAFAATALLHWSACGADTAPVALVCEHVAANRVLLKLAILHVGATPGAHAAAYIEFVSESAPGKPYESSPPGPRSVTLPLPADPKQNIALARFGPFLFDGQTPKRLLVYGGLAGGPKIKLGLLTKTAGRVVFQRGLPKPAAAGEVRVLAAAECEPFGRRRFVLKIAFFNAGESFPADYSAFVHFELQPKGERLDQAMAWKLWPMSQRMDTRSWGPSELAVVRFGPFEIPHGAPRCVYVRAGIYDQFGTKKRLKLAGSDDGTGRVLVGRFLTSGATVRFESAWRGGGR